MPIETPQGTLTVENAILEASSFKATTAVGIGTDNNDAYPLQIFKETAPEIRIHEGATQSSAAKLYSNNSNLYIQTGTNFTSGSSGDIAFQTMGGQATHMIVKSDGKVGVGTGSPQCLLHLSSDTGSASIVPTKLKIHTTTQASDWDNTHPWGLIEFDTDDTSFAGSGPIAGIGVRSGDTTGGYPQLCFYTDNAQTNDTTLGSANERMVINHNGNVGIGTNSPDSKLNIYLDSETGTSDTVGLTITNASSDYTSVTNGFGSRILFRTNRGTSDTNTPQSAQIKGYVYAGAGGTTDYHALDLDVYGDNSSLNKGISIRSMSATGGPADTIVHGKLGIGTNSPIQPLHVNGYTYSAFTATSYYVKGSTTIQTQTNPTGWGVSIYASNDIVAGAAIASNQGTMSASDQRIKTNVVDIEDDQALQTLRLLKPKQYKYKDTIKRGEEPVWGFIAQEVRDTLPYATQLRREFLPNIYELANVSSSNVITFSNFNTSNLEANATTIQVMTKDGKEERATIAQVIDEHTIRVEEDLTDWTGSIDETGNVVAGNQLFIYGQLVDDFVFLKKDAIWTVATSALQEVDRQQQADKLRIEELESQLTSVLARLDALENAP